MNKEKLKKVFSFIGKLVLLVLLTYSAIASTIGCFNSLKKNINETPNKVQEVKRAVISDVTAPINLFTGLRGFGSSWSIREANTSNLLFYIGSNSKYDLNNYFIPNYNFEVGRTYHFSCVIGSSVVKPVNVSVCLNAVNSSNYYNQSYSLVKSFSVNDNTVSSPFNALYNFDVYFVAESSFLSVNISFLTGGEDQRFYIHNPIITFYDNSINEAYSSGYQDGYSEGYDLGNSEGYDYGYSVGEGYVQSHPHNYELYTKQEYDSAYDSGYDVGVMESYDVGYNAGYGAGATDVVNRELAENGFIKLANIVFNAPYNILHNSFNFEFLGINLWALMSFVFTIALVFGVIGFLKRR